MNQNFGLFSVKVGKNWDQLFELLLVLLMLLILGLRIKVHHLNCVLEILRLGIEAREYVFRNELLIIELCDFFLLVKHDAIKLVP